jgi:translation initiation factor 4G
LDSTAGSSRVPSHSPRPPHPRAPHFPPTPQSLDIPKAPELLGRVLGGAAAKGALPLSALPELLAGTEGAEAKRKLAGAAFKAVAADGGEARLAELCAAGGVAAGAFLAADEFDGDLPGVEEWLKAEGITGVPV